MIWYKGNMLKQTGSTERDTKGRNIPLTPPPPLYSNVGRKLFFTWILWNLWYIVDFHIIILPVVSWSGRPHVKIEANYWIKQGGGVLYVCDVWQVTYVSLLSTWLLTWLWASLTTYHLHISHMAARFDLAARLLQRTIRQVTFAHPCIAIDYVRNGDVWLKIVVTYVMLKMVCIPSEINDYWKAKAYIIQMAFYQNKTWDFRVQVFISVISFQRNYTKWWVLSWEIKNLWLNVTYVTFVLRTHRNYVNSSRLSPLWS